MNTQPRARTPLYAKILLWFFLNLAVLALVLFFVFRAQFRLGLDWLLAGDAASRIESVSYLILVEFNERPHSEWTQILERFNQAYQVSFYAFALNGHQLAGAPLDPPPEIKARLVRPLAPLRPMLGPGEQDRERAARPPRPPAFAPAEAPDGVLPPPPELRLTSDHIRLPKAIVRTANPTRYWVLVRGALRRPDRPRPEPVTLVAMSSSLSGGGLFFDTKPWLIAGLGAVLVSALLWLPFVRGITHALAQMTEATDQLAQGHFHVRVTTQRRDELGLLGSAINQMAARLEGFVTGQKRFLSGIAHELCSPLARLQVALGILEQRADESQKPYAVAACEKAEQISALVNELLSFSKAGLGSRALQLQSVAVREAVQKAVQLELESPDEAQLEIEEGLSVQADSDLLVRSLSNLLRNTVRYASGAGPILVRGVRAGPSAQITVADSGPGVPPEHLDKLFDPFYRVDTSRDRTTGGSGLGLTIVKTCIESCGGTVRCGNREPRGFQVTIELPLATTTSGGV